MQPRPAFALLGLVAALSCRASGPASQEPEPEVGAASAPPTLVAFAGAESPGVPDARSTPRRRCGPVTE
jgi:hypothetical protein